MGSLGDKFKKLAGDQTRQLLQNFQNAQSSKTKNGYSYGKLNEDGTATLADGTTVQVEVKGRPGQYAPVFNLGNGQGLVDQPEAKFFNVDSSVVTKFYGLSVHLKQQYSADVPNSDFYYFNLLTQDGVFLKDYVKDEEYQIDPTVCQLLPDFPIATCVVTRSQFGFITQVRLTGGPIFSGGLPFFPSGYPHDELGLSGFDDVEFAYSSVFVQLGAEGKDIILYQQSNIKVDTVLVDSSGTLPPSSIYDIGDLLLKYVILKDFYIEDGLVKSDNLIQGTYEFSRPEITSVVGSPGGSFNPVGYSHEWRAFYQPMLNRDVDNNVQLNVLSYSYTVQIDIVPTYFQVSTGYWWKLVKDITNNPTTTWEFSTSTYPRDGLFRLGQTAMKCLGGEVYGVSSPLAPEGSTDLYKVNITTGAPEGLLSQPYLTTSNFRVLVSRDNFYGLDDFIQVSESLGLNYADGSGSPYLSNYGFDFAYLTLGGFNYTPNSWATVYSGGEGGYYTVVLLTSVEGSLQGRKLNNVIPNSVVSDFIYPIHTIIKGGVTWSSNRSPNYSAVFRS